MKGTRPFSELDKHSIRKEKVSSEKSEDLQILEFDSGNELRKWLLRNYDTSKGIWVRIFKKNSGIKSITFEEVLDEGLCFGWSESMRRKGDGTSYLQRFTPRRTQGTASRRNREHIERLIKERKMTPAGLEAAGIKSEPV